ncbi:DNA mismatch repair protein MutS [Mesorhizobium sp. MSK_1335]|uniref:DNA mismatch repair protein MutS n=1 Tax=Mesorhizobium montanum TaxID=3072323 RepID=A0ABU4ZWA6_9HYPH|nr:DNA mismatch repair protein MutS [Mesorhizobium sp. MSK_1335]MDX8528236.1 DNA mismatch repair protein MutS [Mesorhizobium sp. MSK_1335]
MKAHLMHRDRDFDLKAKLPRNADDLVQDLELDTLFRAMAGEDKFLFEVAKVAILASVGSDAPTILYRQEALKDCIENSGVIRDVYDTVMATIEGRRTRGGLLYLGSYPSGILNHSVELLEGQMEGLQNLRALADANLSRFHSEAFTTLFNTLKEELAGDFMKDVARHLQQMKFRDGILLSATLGDGNKAKSYILRNPSAEKRSWLQRLFGPKEEAYIFQLDPRDDAGARALSELRDRGLNIAANAVAQSAEHILSFLHMLRAELAFYIGCLNLRQRLVAKGEPIAFPVPVDAGERRHHFEGLYDVCLSLSMEKRVVGNDVDAVGKVLTIVTGANTGGKSTFLRSFGLAQLMMQCGMFAPAVSFSANLCDGVFTHYKREEDSSMTSGKFDEELSRMSRIADVLAGNSLVLFNESFAATNDREGSEIAKMIVDVLLKKGIKMVFVTHLYAFAHAYVDGKSDDLMFLRAEREPDGTRTFKLVEAEPLRTSFGQDLYQAVFQDGPRKNAAA